ncbi:hypothetical protein OQA88_12472 [Cercophora sp. LCS_1]
MSSFNPIAGYSVASALAFIATFAAVAFTLNVFKGIAPVQSRPARLSHLFLKLAAPTLIVGLFLFGLSCALIASSFTSYHNYDGISTAAAYISMVSELFCVAANIGITLSLYTLAIAELYAVIGNNKWWKLLRLDAPAGGAILMILNIAIFGRRIAISVEGEYGYADTVVQRWFPFVINGTLLLVTVGVLVTVFYSGNKLKKRDGALQAAFSNIPTLLYIATFLWLLRCSYAWALDIKVVGREWGTSGELAAIIILTPFLDLWTATALVYLLATVIRAPVWGDASAHPDPINPGIAGSNGAQQDGHPKY